VRRSVVVLFALALVAAGVPGCQWFEAGSSQEAAEFGLVPVSTDQPPPWQLERVGGGRLGLNDLKGQVALLYFWTTW
jgi:cytochrome oxidase Cu insertion factor (SCO1/SenC/PrrC family)